jgi:hypothetical protein
MISADAKDMGNSKTATKTSDERNISDLLSRVQGRIKGKENTSMTILLAL